MRPRLYLLAAALLWSTAGAAIKLSALGGWTLACARALVASLTLLLLLPEVRRLPSWRTALVGLAYAGTTLSFVLATTMTTAANAIFLQDTAPLYVVLLSPLLLREKPRASELAALPVFALGLSLFFVDQLTPGQLTGNLVALASGVFFALSILGLRALGTGADQGALAGNLIAFVIALPFAVSEGAAGARPLDVLIVLYLGSTQLALAYMLFARGIKDTPALEGSLIILLEPVLNPVWAFLVTGERPGGWALLGGSIILGASLWRTVRS